jgi:hypothetical protein
VHIVYDIVGTFFDIRYCMSGIRYRKVTSYVVLNIDIVYLHTISYVFFQGNALLSQSPWDPPMLWAYGPNLLNSVCIL